MPRPTTITDKQILETIEDLKEAGDPVTVRSVREKLGTGSFETINKVMKKWRDKEFAVNEHTIAKEVIISIKGYVQREVDSACIMLVDKAERQQKEIDELVIEHERHLEKINDLELEWQGEKNDRIRAETKLEASINLIEELKVTLENEREKLVISQREVMSIPTLKETIEELKKQNVQQQEQINAMLKVMQKNNEKIVKPKKDVL